MSLTKDEAAELKRLIADAGKAVWDEATLNVNTRSSWQCNKVLHTYIDSLTQPAPELTDEEWIELAIRDVAELPDRDSPADWPEAMLVTADELRNILADRAKRSKQ